MVKALIYYFNHKTGATLNSEEIGQQSSPEAYLHTVESPPNPLDLKRSDPERRGRDLQDAER